MTTYLTDEVTRFRDVLSALLSKFDTIPLSESRKQYEAMQKESSWIHQAIEYHDKMFYWSAFRRIEKFSRN